MSTNLPSRLCDDDVLYIIAKNFSIFFVVASFMFRFLKPIGLKYRYRGLGFFFYRILEILYNI